MWFVCQIGAREHYAIPRALHGAGELAALLTDFWIKPGSSLGKLPGAKRLKDRYHDALHDAKVIAPNLRMLGFEAGSRLRKRRGWKMTMARNALFQREALAALALPITDHRSPITLFSYSYAALELFRFAKARGWQTVLGQIDPGPEEERIVAEEQRAHPALVSRWQPAPARYWEIWREEVALADRVIVNSEWSRRCLLKEGVPADKMEVVPLVYEAGSEERRAETDQAGHRSPTADRRFRLLFLGQVNLRKGVARLLEAMRLLRDEPVELILAGPSEIDPAAWADLPKVRWIGRVPRSGVGEVYRDADAFILPTLSDGFALTQLEALAHGLPVIASKHCGDVVRDGVNGWLLSDLAPVDMAGTIQRAMDGPLDPMGVCPPRFGLADLAKSLVRQVAVEGYILT